MTPAQLAALLEAAGQPPLPTEGDAYDALDRLEAACEAASAPERERAFGALLRRVEATEGLSPVIDGVRREALVRWDSCSVTFTGHDVHTGAPVMVRTLHPFDDPRRVRWLARQGRDVPGARVPAPGTLVVDLPGRPLGARRPADPELAKLLASGLLAIGQRSLPELGPEELREVDGRAVVVCLSRGPDSAGAVRALAHTLTPDGDGPMADLVRGLAELPPGDAESAGQLLTAAMARELAAMRHHLRARWSATLQHTRLERLVDTLERLQGALPPPRGRAAAGVDLDGEVLAVASDEDEVSFGLPHAMQPVWTRDDGFDARHARRLLRAQAAAPPNPRLSRDLGGDAAFGDAIGRWVAAGMRLRTLRMLLKQARS